VRSKLDHGRGLVHTDDLVACIGKFSCPNSAPTSEVYDKSLGDVVLSEQLQEARCRGSGKPAEANIVDVSEIVPVSLVRVDHVCLFKVGKPMFSLAYRRLFDGVINLFLPSEKSFQEEQADQRKGDALKRSGFALFRPDMPAPNRIVPRASSLIFPLLDSPVKLSASLNCG
jgi:hypothetical protein